MENKMNSNNKYIIVVINACWSDQIELITTDFKQAFEHVYSQSDKLHVWISGEHMRVLETNIITKDLKSMYTVFKNIQSTGYNDLAEIALPIIKERKDKYEEEIKNKELKELARLKAKYEGK